MQEARAPKINGILENIEDKEDIRDDTESDIGKILEKIMFNLVLF